VVFDEVRTRDFQLIEEYTNGNATSHSQQLVCFFEALCSVHDASVSSDAPPAFLKLDLMYLILAKRTGHEKWPATIGLQAIFYFKNNKLRGGERGIRTLDGDFVPILP
jgi:hypothetical protein